jgi:hypothetical protein
VRKNIGKVERAVRIVFGIGVLPLAFVGPQSPWAYLGVLPLVTGLVGWCPPYALLGIGTGERDPEESRPSRPRSA